MKRLWVILFLIIPLIGQQVCQYDGGKLSNTGQGKIKNGKSVNLWKCLQGHEYWIVNTFSKISTNPSSKSSSSSSSASAFENTNNILKARLAREESFRQQELAALSQMTPEQRREYFQAREERMKAEKEIVRSCGRSIGTLFLVFTAVLIISN